MINTRLLLLGAVAASATVPFTPVDSLWNAPVLSYPANLHMDILYKVGDTVDLPSGAKGAARKTFDYIGFHGLGASAGNDSALLGVNNELDDSSTTFGDGGGFNVFKIARDPGTGAWKRAGNPYSIDFRSIGGTWHNCGGFDTHLGTMVSGEEYPPASNADAYLGSKAIRDTSDFVVKTQGFDDTLKRHQALGWMVEIDPVAKTARKLYRMGRFSHEGGILLPDHRTVILTDDNTPAVLFKFVATTADDLSQGQLHAYKQSEDGMSGSWIELPMELDSLVNIRDIAIRKGATVGIRHEWNSYHDGRVFISETGLDNDKRALRKAVDMGAVVEKHLQGGIWTNDTAKDLYGRVLALDVSTNKLSVLVEGGVGSTGRTLSNPDGQHVHIIGNKAWLVILEDLNGSSGGRDPGGNNNCEAWWLDLSIQNPTVDSLQRMVVGVNGAELTGSTRTPDGKTMFLAVQHPSSSNTAPWDKDVVAAFTGFEASSGIVGKGAKPNRHPFRQTRGEIRFEVPTDGTVRDLEGNTLMTFKKSGSVNVPQGASVLRTSEGTWMILKP